MLRLACGDGAIKAWNTYALPLPPLHYPSTAPANTAQRRCSCAPAVPTPSTEWSSFTIRAVAGAPSVKVDTWPGPAWRSCRHREAGRQQ